MKIYLPKKTNDNAVPRDILFKGVGPSNDGSDFEKRKKIILQNNHEYTRQKYEKMGIKVTADDDDLFYTVDLPDGWTKESISLYWTVVLDNKGRRRILYFTKLAAYNKDSFSNFCTRYSYAIVPFDDFKASTYEDRKFRAWTLYITDGEDRIKRLNQIVPTTDEEYYKVDDVLAEEAVEYLNQNYPGWEDPDNYWG